MTYLNQLRRDVQDVLDDIQQTGVDLDSACYDLSQIHPHDVKTDDDRVKVLYDNVQDTHKKLFNLLIQFKQARDKYLEFF